MRRARKNEDGRIQGLFVICVFVTCILFSLGKRVCVCSWLNPNLEKNPVKIACVYFNLDRVFF